MTSSGSNDADLRAQLDLLTAGTLDERAAVLVLRRPGPLTDGTAAMYLCRRDGRDTFGYDDAVTDAGARELLARLLGPTQGLLLYREQIISLASTVAQFSPQEQNALWRATNELGSASVEGFRERFVSRRTAAWNHTTASQLWDLVVAASPYVLAAGDAYRGAARARVDDLIHHHWPR